MAMQINEYLQIAADKLAHSPTPRLDAEVLLAHVFRVSRADLYAHADEVIASNTRFEELITRRQQNEPIAYIIQQKEFWSLPLLVTPEVLIPRPETELLVELALRKLDTNKKCKVLDLGTGSGAIALALADERPNWEIHATDCSDKALQIARQNALKLGLNVTFHCGDWFEPVALHQFNAIISNPPYIAIDDPHLAQLQFEPASALIAGIDGLDSLRLIIAKAKEYLTPHGWLLVEHGYDQSIAVAQLMRQHNLREITRHQDLGRQDRVVSGVK